MGVETPTARIGIARRIGYWRSSSNGIEQDWCVYVYSYLARVLSQSARELIRVRGMYANLPAKVHGVCVIPGFSGSWTRQLRDSGGRGHH